MWIRSASVAAGFEDWPAPVSAAFEYADFVDFSATESAAFEYADLKDLTATANVAFEHAGCEDFSLAPGSEVLKSAQAYPGQSVAESVQKLEAQWLAILSLAMGVKLLPSHMTVDAGVLAQRRKGSCVHFEDLRWGFDCLSSSPRHVRRDRSKSRHFFLELDSEAHGCQVG